MTWHLASNIFFMAAFIGTAWFIGRTLWIMATASDEQYPLPTCHDGYAHGGSIEPLRDE